MKTAFAGTLRGFTILELSIVLTLIGVIIGMGLVVLTASVQQAAFNKTVERMDAIEKALLNFSTGYNRIPCPGDLTLTLTNAMTGTYYNTTAGANYGLEAGADAKSAIGVGTGVCAGTNMTPQANFTSTSGVAEGGVPTRALKLPDDYMYDGWGRRFRYAVDPSATIAGSIPSMTLSCSPITINDSTGAVRSAAAIYALISHGANGHGAYTSHGVALNAGSVNQGEQTNCHCDNNGVSQSYPLTSFQPSGTATGFTGVTYVEKVPTLDPSNALDNFDDIVTFKESWQLQTPNNQVTPSSLYIADSSNNVIRQISASMNGIITTIAGNNTVGYAGAGGTATSAQLHSPVSVAVDTSGNIYVVDQWNAVIRKVTISTGILTTIAGTLTPTPPSNWGYSGDTGPATSAELDSPYNVALDSSGNLYIADYGNNRIRKVTVATGIIATVAGTGTAGYSGDGGAATSAKINYPDNVAVDVYGNIYIADTANNRIRKVTVATGIITTAAGTGTAGYSGDGAAATSAKIDNPWGVAVDGSGNIYIGDEFNYRIRKVTAATGFISTIAGTGVSGYSGDYGPATSAKISAPTGIALDSSGNLYFPDGMRIRKVTVSGTICTIAGNGTAGYAGNGGAATSAEIKGPEGVAVFTSR